MVILIFFCIFAAVPYWVPLKPIKYVIMKIDFDFGILDQEVLVTSLCEYAQANYRFGNLARARHCCQLVSRIGFGAVCKSCHRKVSAI